MTRIFLLFYIIKTPCPLPNHSRSCLCESMNLQTLTGPGRFVGNEARILVSDEAAQTICILPSDLYKHGAKTSSSGVGKLLNFSEPPFLTCEILTDPTHTAELLLAGILRPEKFKTLMFPGSTVVISKPCSAIIAGPS